MKKRFLLGAAVALVAAGFSVAAPAGKDGSWTGVVGETHCGATMTDAACVTKCVTEGKGQYALITKTKKVYVLDKQDDAAKYAGQKVKVTGSLDGDKIAVTSIDAASM
jgi:hypothetical protein